MTLLWNLGSHALVKFAHCQQSVCPYQESRTHCNSTVFGSPCSNRTFRWCLCETWLIAPIYCPQTGYSSVLVESFTWWQKITALSGFFLGLSPHCRTEKYQIKFWKVTGNSTVGYFAFNTVQSNEGALSDTGSVREEKYWLGQRGGEGGSGRCVSDLPGG